jgi:general secretion pathway protein N
MVKWSKILGLTLLSGGILMAGPAAAPRAATSATTDILSGDRTGEVTDSVDLGSLKPIARPNRRWAGRSRAGTRCGRSRSRS